MSQFTDAQAQLVDTLEEVAAVAEANGPDALDQTVKGLLRIAVKQAKVIQHLSDEVQGLRATVGRVERAQADASRAGRPVY